MTTPGNPADPFTPFLPSTYNLPEEEDRLKTYLVDHFSVMADVVNDKTIGTYTQETESFNGEKWSYDTTSKIRNGYQALAYLPSVITTSIPLPVKNVNSQFVIKQVWGSASLPCSEVGAGDGDYFSFFSEGNSKVTFTMSDTTINITTTTDLSAYKGFIVIEYIRDGQ